MTGTVFNIQHFCTQDGPGIRTTVFLKGCPMNCIWCHNPESRSSKPVIQYFARKCTGCSACVSACPEGRHSIAESIHSFDRQGCTGCGACAENCPSEALVLCGRSVTAEEVLHEVMQDKIFYGDNGGMTVSGGEPAAQPAFTAELLKLAKESGIHTSLETSGFCSKEVLANLIGYTDLFLFDYKVTDPRIHSDATGVANNLILSNLAFLDSENARIILRCPVIPGINMNEAHFKAICSIAAEYMSIQEIQLEPYHPLGIDKSQSIGEKPVYSNQEFLSAEKVTKLWHSVNPASRVPVSVI